MDRVDELKAFVAVADERSFVAAARRLERSAASITRAVASLEERLDTRLFTRTTRAVVLSEAGRRHLDKCREILSGFAALQSDIARSQGEPRGSLAVTASIVFGRLHVLPVVSDFLRRYPSLDVRLILADEVKSLVDEGLDVGVRIAHLADSTLKAVRVGSVRRAVYASPAYLAARGEPRVPTDLAEHACIAFTGLTPTPDRWRFGRGRTGTTVTVRPRLVVNLAEAAIDAARAGLGLTCALSYMVDHLVAADLLLPVLRRFEPPPLPVHVVHPAGPHLPRKTRLFVDALTVALRKKLSAPAAASSS
jgi:DNA-binding transcriptional LysR family regulator